MNQISYKVGQLFYKIKKNDLLVFTYKRFPYPPFSDYRFENDNKDVKINDTTEHDFMAQEGSSISAKTTFTCEKTGAYNIKVIEQSPYKSDILHNIIITVE